MMRIMNARPRLTIALICLLAATTTFSERPALGAEKIGLSVNAEGVVIKDGKPYRAIGINYFSAFYRKIFNSPTDTSYREGFKVLAAHNIPYVRMLACPFYPSEYSLYLKDKEAYFRLMDDVIKAAEEAKVGIIPSLFFNQFAIPDVVGEPMDQWGNPKSKTHAFMRQYVADFIGRYKNSPSIWGWEFGNEFTLFADLPNASAWRPQVIPQLGMNGPRSERDELSASMIVTAFVEFAKAVRQHDPDRIILTGNAIPRFYAYHSSLDRSWTADTRAQYAEMLLRDNPDPMNGITVHIYTGADAKTEYFADKKVDLDELIKETNDIAIKARKPLFIGEFGAGSSLGQPAEREGITRLINSIEKHKVPLSAMWDFDGFTPDTSWVKEWRTTADNARGYMLDLIGEANRRIAEEMKAK